MARDSKGRFVANQAEAVPLPEPGALQWELVITLLERIAYNTAQTHLTYDEYLRARVYKETPYGDDSAPV